MNIPSDLAINQVRNIFESATGFQSSNFDLGFICRYCEELNLVSREDILSVLSKDIVKLYNSLHSDNQILYDSIFSYYSKEVGKINVKYSLAIKSNSNLVSYIPFNKGNLVTLLKNIHLRGIPANNYIVIDKEYFDKNNLEYTLSKLLSYRKSKVNYNIKILGEDLKTDLMTDSGINMLMKSLCTIIEASNISDIGSSHANFRLFVINFLKEHQISKRFWLPKSFSDNTLSKDSNFGSKNLFLLSYLTLKMSFNFYFEDSAIRKEYATFIQVLYTHNYDTIYNQLDFIDSIDNKLVVLVSKGDNSIPLSIGTVKSPKISFTTGAIDMLDILNPSPLEAKLSFITLHNLSYEKEDIVPMEDFLEILPEYSPEYFKDCKNTKEVTDKIFKVFSEMQCLAIHLLKGELVRKANLVVVMKDDMLFLTVLDSRTLSLNFTGKYLKGVSDEGLVYEECDREVKLDSIMPIKVFEFFDTNAKYNDIDTFVCKYPQVMAYIDARKNTDKARDYYVSKIYSNRGKGFYEYLLVLNQYIIFKNSEELYHSLKDYDSNATKLLAFNDAGNIAYSRISDIM